MSSFLTHFKRSEEIYPTDWGEKIGNFGLGLLRIGFGKTVEIKKISNEATCREFEDPIILRIAAVALAVITLPITLILAGIGCIGFACSATHPFLLTKTQQRSSIRPPTSSTLKPKIANPVKNEDWKRVFQKKGSFYTTVPSKIQALLDPKDRVPTKSEKFSELDLCLYSDKSREKIKQDLNHLISIATHLDGQIKTLYGPNCSLLRENALFTGYDSFKFDIEKWNTILEQLSNPSLTFRASNLKSLYEESRLDLIEALAEFNIDKRLLNGPDQIKIEEIRKEIEGIPRSTEIGEKAITSLIFPQEINGKNISSRYASILDEAKETVKGNVHLYEIFTPISESSNTYSTFHKLKLDNSHDNSSDLIAQGDISNPECDGWSQDYYRKYLKYGAFHIHLDWLIGKKNGDRIIIPKDGTKMNEDFQTQLRKENFGICSNQRKEHIILRFFGTNKTPLEEFLLLALLKDKYNPLQKYEPAIKAREEALKRIEESYGKEFRVTIEQEYLKPKV
jgi:hypothetical protein